MLASLFNVFDDQRGLAQFSFANADLHRRQNDAIFAAGGALLPYYVLDPLPLGSARVNWLEAHQALHERVNTVLGIASNDLTDVDFTDRNQLAAWVWLHAQEHLQAVQRLGIS